MQLGRHLRELLRLRLGVIVSAVLALLIAVWSVAEVSLFPPRLESRSVEIATAHTQLVVDTPKSAIVDLRQATTDIDSLKNRAVLIGNVMASPPVRAEIARRAGIPPAGLQIITPRTPTQPRPRETGDSKKAPTDLLRSTDRYRLDIQANPTVPILDIYAQAPTAESAARVANASAAGLGDYLADVSASEQTPEEMRVRVRQLGSARGDVINEGIALQLAVLTFLLVFAASSAAAVVIARVRRGWRMAALAEEM